MDLSGWVSRAFTPIGMVPISALSLGAGEYMEVIAVNPAAPPPGRPRWFDLDRFTGAPRITNWILRCDDLDAALSLAPPGTGR